MNLDSQFSTDVNLEIGMEGTCFCGSNCTLGCARTCVFLCGGCGNACSKDGICLNFCGWGNSK